jgi:uncharacterized protein YjbJ (UPF0337 family)
LIANVSAEPLFRTHEVRGTIFDCIGFVSIHERSEPMQMDWNRVEGNWKQVKGKVKEQWGKLTDDDLDVINGRRDQLEGKIRSATATLRIRSLETSMIGTAGKAGRR